MPALTHLVLALARAALALPWLATAAGAQIVAQPPIRIFTVKPPTIPVPDGYGRKCSMTWSDGSWALGALPAKDSDPSGDIQKQRARRWNTAGNNNAMVRCNQGIWLYRDANDTAILNAYNAFKNRTDPMSCVFTIAPTRLPVFGEPWKNVTPCASSPATPKCAASAATSSPARCWPRAARSAAWATSAARRPTRRTCTWASSAPPTCRTTARCRSATRPAAMASARSAASATRSAAPPRTSTRWPTAT